MVQRVKRAERKARQWERELAAREAQRQHFATLAVEWSEKEAARRARGMTPLEMEAKAAMDAVCRGEATAWARPTPDEVFAGNVHFHLSNGWQVIVFNDCDEWDYIDQIIAPDGRTIDIPEPVTDAWPLILGHWHPQCEPHDGDGFCVHWSGGTPDRSPAR